MYDEGNGAADRRSASYPTRHPDAGQALEYALVTDDRVPVAVIRRAGVVVETLRVIEPNSVHVAVYDARRSGWTDLGASPNLRTTAGLDWEAAILGGIPGTTSGSPATAVTATSLTATGSPWGVNAYKGWRVHAVNTGGAPVYGNIGSNTSSVLTVDGWWLGNDTASGTNPAATAQFAIAPGQGNARYIGLTTNTTAPSAADLTLVGELTANGLGRALGTYSHTGGATNYVLSKVFSYTGSVPVTVTKAGAFTAATATAGGLMVYETLLAQTATVSSSGDQITFTWTANI